MILLACSNAFCQFFFFFFQDLKLQLSGTGYGNFLANVPSPLATSIIQEKAFGRLVEDFRYVRAQATEPLAKFMDFITHGYMIDNVALLITGTVHDRDREEMLTRVHPLGWFESLPAISVATDIASLYDMILIDSPLAPYFKDNLSAEELDDLNIEVIRNKLYKAYLQEFYKFSQTLPSPTNEIMARLLEFEADRRTINIAINSIGTQLSRENRLSLFPEFGSLAGAPSDVLARAEDVEQIKFAIDTSGSPSIDSSLLDGSSNKSLEDHFYQKEMELCKAAFTQQFTYSTVWAWIKTREQEIRNITWIAECIAQNQKDRVHNYIAVF